MWREWRDVAVAASVSEGASSPELISATGGPAAGGRDDFGMGAVGVGAVAVGVGAVGVGAVGVGAAGGPHDFGISTVDFIAGDFGIAPPDSA